MIFTLLSLILLQVNVYNSVEEIFQSYVKDKNGQIILGNNIDYLNNNPKKTIVELDSVFSLINQGSLYSNQIDKLMDLPFSKEIQNQLFNRLLTRNALNALALSKKNYLFPNSMIIGTIECKDSMTVKDWNIYLTLVNNYNVNMPDSNKIIPKEIDSLFNKSNNITDTIFDLKEGRKSGKILKDDLAYYTIHYAEQWH